MNDPNLILNQEDTLLERFLMIHNQLYKLSKEWFFIEKDFVLSQMLPYMDKNAPFYYPPPIGKSFQGKVFLDLKKDDAFMNLLKSGRSYKSYIFQVYKVSLLQISSFRNQIDSYLRELEKED